MLVRERKGTVRMVNEDGHQWSDPAWWWIAIGNETDADRERWAKVWEEPDEDYDDGAQSGAEFMAAYYNSDSYINYLNG
jgi:hypothetical protein